MGRYFKVPILVAFVTPICMAQMINITGVVKDSASGTALRGALVSLAVGKLMTTTDSLGRFALIGKGGGITSSRPSIRASVNIPEMLPNGVMRLNLAGAGPVRVDAVALDGRLARRTTAMLPAGEHLLKVGAPAPGLLVLRVVIGRAHYRFIRLATGDMGSSGGPAAFLNSAEPGLAKATAALADTVTVSATGYYLKRTAIASQVATGLVCSLTFAGSADTVVDVDGNVYHTVILGKQVWLKEDLKTTKYRDGTAVPLITENDLWSKAQTPAYCWHSNDEKNKTVYGALYNWHVANPGNPRKIAPRGWHVPSEGDWSKLSALLGGENTAGGSMKEVGGAHWKTPNIGATNISRLTALPGSYRDPDGAFGTIGTSAVWWSTNAANAATGFSRSVNNFTSDLNIDASLMRSGFSIRCIGDGELPANLKVVPRFRSVILTWEAAAGAAKYNIYYAAGPLVNRRSGTRKTLETGDRTTDTVTSLTIGLQYSFSVAALRGDSAKGYTEGALSTPVPTIPGLDTVMDIEGNVYHTVMIGRQKWMTENLRTETFNDGTPIPLVANDEAWAGLTTPGYCWYDNDEAANKQLYGALYNGFAVTSGKLAPEGWHVASESDWTALVNTLDGESKAAEALKDTGTAWQSPNYGATNKSDFTALPGGDRNLNGSFFTSNKLRNATWWSSTFSDPEALYTREIQHAFGFVSRGHERRARGFYVRCIKD